MYCFSLIGLKFRNIS